MLYPLNFDALYIWTLCFNMIEIMGHSGLRLYYPTVLTGAFLRPFNCELVIEDHDLHHRFGWRDSCNYGKQTLFWDTLFGTTRQRIETNYENVDWSRRALRYASPATWHSLGPVLATYSTESSVEGTGSFLAFWC